MTLGAEDSPATFPYGPARSKSFQNLVSRVVHSFLLFHTVCISGVQPVWSCHQERIMKHPDTQVGTPAGHLRRLFSVCHLPSDQMNPIAPVTCQPQRPTPITIQNVSPKNCHKTLVANDKHPYFLNFLYPLVVHPTSANRFISERGIPETWANWRWCRKLGNDTCRARAPVVLFVRIVYRYII